MLIRSRSLLTYAVANYHSLTDGFELRIVGGDRPFDRWLFDRSESRFFPRPSFNRALIARDVQNAPCFRGSQSRNSCILTCENHRFGRNDYSRITYYYVEYSIYLDQINSEVRERSYIPNPRVITN